MIRKARGFLSDDLGQAVVLIAFAMAALLLGVGLAIDTGTLFVARRHAQAAADASAWAGAVILYRGGTASAATAAAQTDATENGYTSGASSTTVSIVTPPTSGEWAGDTRFIEVSITRNVRTIFLPGAVAGGFTAVSARAIAGAAPTGIGLAILTLGTGTALEASGGARLSVSGADILVNSNDTNNAARTVGTSAIAVTSPNVTKVVGAVSGSGFTPTPQTSAAPAFDPFLALPEPTSATTRSVSMPISSDTTLSPGVYPNGIKVTGGTITLEPGVYILKDGGLDVTGNARLTGSGVMFFNTVADHPASTGDCDPITIAGTTQTSLSAPTASSFAGSAVYKGMLVWQDKDCDLPISLTGNGMFTTLSGTFYAPAAIFGISGTSGGDFSIDSQIIASKVDITGTATITLNYDANKTAKPLVPSLVE